jgi:hypothetical protein
LPTDELQMRGMTFVWTINGQSYTMNTIGDIAVNDSDDRKYFA